MGKYSIKDLEKLSGVKAHTIRIWEQRYHLLAPKRTETNIRFYDDEQLKHLLNVSLLLKNGLKISKISELKPNEIYTLLLQYYSNENTSSSFEDKINGLVVSMIELNESMFEKIVSSVVLQLGFEETVIKLIYPFLDKVGILWTVGEINPAQEHFISNLIRQKMIAAIDGQALNINSKKKFLLFLPESELHELGLLMSNYLIRKHGHQSIYLGQNVPFGDIKQVYALCKPTALITFLTTPATPSETEEYLKKLCSDFNKTPIYISGSLERLSNVKIPSKINWLKSIQELKAIL